MNLLKMLSLFQVLSFTAPAHMFRKALDAMLDSLEDQIAASATPIDNVVLTPVIGGIRTFTKTPDDYDGDED